MITWKKPKHLNNDWNILTWTEIYWQKFLFRYEAKRAGLDMKTFWDCIRASAGNSFVWETGGPMVMQGTYDPSFTIDLQSKDNQLGYEMAKKYKVLLIRSWICDAL